MLRISLTLQINIFIIIVIQSILRAAITRPSLALKCPLKIIISNNIYIRGFKQKMLKTFKQKALLLAYGKYITNLMSVCLTNIRIDINRYFASSYFCDSRITPLCMMLSLFVQLCESTIIHLLPIRSLVHVFSHHTTISYHITSYHYITSLHTTISHHIISYHITSHHFIPLYHIISYHIISHYITSLHTTISHHIISHYITSLHTTISHHITPTTPRQAWDFVSCRGASRVAQGSQGDVRWYWMADAYYHTWIYNEVCMSCFWALRRSVTSSRDRSSIVEVMCVSTLKMMVLCMNKEVILIRFYFA